MEARVNRGEGCLVLKSLREWRRERLFSLAELAERAGVTEKTVGDIERGHARPRLGTVRKLSDVLGVEPREVAEFGAAIRGADGGLAASRPDEFGVNRPNRGVSDQENSVAP